MPDAFADAWSTLRGSGAAEDIRHSSPWDIEYVCIAQTRLRWHTSDSASDPPNSVQSNCQPARWTATNTVGRNVAPYTFTRRAWLSSSLTQICKVREKPIA